ncbi:hypothetical protein PSI22_18700 [Xenorhabdus sp. XENO-7]|uniref:Transposase n=1 Tax=Xenorhabdus aichiensis TaxID=3025874 RepID=A0ABT5M7D5_9GAMM|nr:hypothetical protein [Xenorhabdus aichiensis]MDC9623611.1 hypothetical protein [Xenorhabdus aichiensis]
MKQPRVPIREPEAGRTAHALVRVNEEEDVPVEQQEGQACTGYQRRESDRNSRA